MAKKDIHIVPHKDGWASRKEGASRAGKVYDTQRQAQDGAPAGETRRCGIGDTRTRRKNPGQRQLRQRSASAEGQEALRASRIG